jgi:hypothetical protein
MAMFWPKMRSGMARRVVPALMVTPMGEVWAPA